MYIYISPIRKDSNDTTMAVRVEIAEINLIKSSSYIWNRVTDLSAFRILFSNYEA